MRIYYPVVLLILMVGISGCGLAEREKRLKDHEARLLQKEQELLAKEQLLLQKETSLNALEQTLDSNKKIWDTVGVYEPALVGDWAVTMTCTETSCEGSAIGDKKTERWVIFYENASVKVNAYSGKNLTRTYLGLYKNNQLSLKVPDDTQGTVISVQMRPATDKQNKFIGKREIQQPNCKIVYELDVTKKLTGKN